MFGLTGDGADHVILAVTGSHQFSANGEDAGLGAGSSDIDAEQIGALFHDASDFRLAARRLATRKARVMLSGLALPWPAISNAEP